MNPLEEMKKRREEEERQTEQAAQEAREKAAQKAKAEKEKAEQVAKRNKIEFTLEAYHNVIDTIFAETAAEIKSKLTEAYYNKKAPKILNKLEKYREEYKEKIRKNFEILDNEILTQSRKAYLKYKITSAQRGFKIKCIRFTYNITFKAGEGIEGLLAFFAIAIVIAGIVLAIKHRSFLIPIPALIISCIFFICGEHGKYRARKKAYGEGYISVVRFDSVNLCGIHLLIISIIAGLGFGSFLLGLSGVIISIIIFVIGEKLFNK